MQKILLSAPCTISGWMGAQIEDKVPLTALEKEQMFVDILPDGPADDGIAYLSFFVEEKEDGSLELNGEPVTEAADLRKGEGRAGMVCACSVRSGKAALR